MALQKKHFFRLLFAIATVYLLGGGSCVAQTAYPDVPGNRYLVLADEQYTQEHYAMAAQSARMFLTSQGNSIALKSSTDIEKANYYIALAGVKTNATGCIDTAKKVIKTTKSVAYQQRLNYAIAQYYFQHNKMAEAIPYYETTGVDNLDNKEIGDKQFEMAYCYFNNKQFDKAEPLFASMKDLKDGQYYKAGNYYYGLLAYNKNKYKEALESFDKIKYDKDYKMVVPYYVAEIYYFMGDRAKALQTADYCIKNVTKNIYDNELHLLAAQCLFEDEHLAEALPYFEYYYEHTDKIKKEDLYKMAYCYYRVSDWQKAVDKFKLLNNAKDSLGQSSMYILGDCYLKMNDKPSARNAFGICADMPYNPGQQEASMILYAKISYEMGYHDEATRELNNLLKTFPHTQFKDEANTLLSDLLIKTNKFEDALTRLEYVKNKNDDYWLDYQKANFGYAVQKFRQDEIGSAYRLFTLSLKHPVDPDYESAAYFWKGELAYRLHQYADVITYSQNFIGRKSKPANIARISPLATVQHAYLNMGYAAMETQNFSSAQNYFNHAQEAKSNDGFSESVARLREADAVFMQKNFQKAIVLYDKVAATDTTNADYANFQKSIILGLQGKNNDKIALLQKIVNKIPQSPYANDARYEIAVTYIEMNKYPLALEYLQQLTDNVSEKSLAPKAFMKKGFIYQQMNDIDKAIDAYKHVVADYPVCDERQAALDALRSLYIQKNQPGMYAQLLRDYNLPASDNNNLDSTYYAAAEGQFATGNWGDAKQAMDDYLKNFPNGIFSVKAHYYRGECYYQLKDYDHAQNDYKVVLAGAWSDFSDNSAKHIAAIAFDNKNYDTAYHYYELLNENTENDKLIETSLDGMMKSGFNCGKYNETISCADTLLTMPGISAETNNDALLYKAKTLQHFSKNDSAIAIYKQLSENKNGDVAAEAHYRIAESFYGLDSLKDAEDAANETIKLSAGYDYWIVKSYILLADILTKEKDYFNARATLESIVKHTHITELKDEAEKKLEDVKKLEKKISKLSDE